MRLRRKVEIGGTDDDAEMVGPATVKFDKIAAVSCQYGPFLCDRKF